MLGSMVFVKIASIMRPPLSNSTVSLPLCGGDVRVGRREETGWGVREKKKG